MVEFKDYPDKTTPVNATNLNKMQTDLKELIEENVKENVIEDVKVNGTSLTVTDKAVDIIVPTKTSELTNDSGYLTEHQNISGKEDVSNKVTSISSSSTNTQYPSAKCVYDLVGDIETLLAEV